MEHAQRAGILSPLTSLGRLRVLILILMEHAQRVVWEQAKQANNVLS